ncbi:MAG: hypothetical protein ACK5TH_24630 [Prosthecobacter sp.]|jgi:hypothetical protein
MQTIGQSESRLLQKARQHGLASPEDLERLAIERGCDYYDISNRVMEQPARDAAAAASGFSNEELAVALLAQNRSLLRTRMAAAMLACPSNKPTIVAQLSRAEGCADVVHYIADCGLRVEPANGFWHALSDALRDVTYVTDDMPHLSRFVEMTGIDRGRVGTQMRWIRPWGGATGG